MSGVDPALRQAYLSLPLSLREALYEGDPAAETELRDAYLSIKAVTPNRATRRATLKAHRKAHR